MLNWADLTTLLIILFGPLCGISAAHEYKRGVLSFILFGCVGLAIGVGIAFASNKLVYRALFLKTLPSGLKQVIYMFIPIIALLLVFLIQFWLAAVIYGKT
jgi:hypothetical protein